MADLAFNEIVNFEKLVSNGAEYKTTIDPSYLPRLAEACSSVLQPVKVEFRFYEDLQGLRTIEGSFSAKVRFVCQRCQKEFDKEITGHFQSTCDEEKARSLKLEEKLDELQRELEVMRAEILDNDQHTGRITKSTCGFTLTSEQAIFFIDHPEEFEKFKAEQEAVSQDLTAVPQEAPQEVQETQEEAAPAPVNDPFEQ